MRFSERLAKDILDTVCKVAAEHKVVVKGLNVEKVVVKGLNVEQELLSEELSFSLRLSDMSDAEIANLES